MPGTKCAAAQTAAAVMSQRRISFTVGSSVVGNGSRTLRRRSTKPGAVALHRAQTAQNQLRLTRRRGGRGDAENFDRSVSSPRLRVIAVVVRDPISRRARGR